MFAVVESGGKQYFVEPGDRFRVEKLEGEVGSQVTLDRVLLVGADELRIGTPHVQGATITASIARQAKDKKIIVFKMKRRKRYRRKNGHRQPFTELVVGNIEIG